MFPSPEKYVGRFAPSPTGPLHFGSLVAATASYLDARSHHGTWIVRIEDLDLPRVQAGAADTILKSLEEFGFEWDGAILYQSSRTGAYQAAFDALKDGGFLYPCGCTRREAADSVSGPADEPRYPGTCRGGIHSGRAPRAWRLRVPSESISFADRAQGLRVQNVESYCGDFILKRADGFFAYQLAVVVDDRDQRVTDVVRGADLLDSTPRQIYLQHLLHASRPRYLHTPVVLNDRGQKLSKQTRAPAINAASALPTLCDVLTFLGHQPPMEVRSGDIQDLWEWAKANWSIDKIPRTQSARLSD